VSAHSAIVVVVHESTGRARPLAPEQRKASIIEACIPLLFEHGAAVTSKQIADAAGVAEGTIFRAFGDKESLIAASVEHFLDPEPIRRSLSHIDPELELEQKVNDILFHLRSRFTGIMGIMSAIGTRPTGGNHEIRRQLIDIITTVLAGEADRLRVTPEQAAYLIRIIAFAASIDSFNSDYQLETAELASFVVHGIGNGPQ
jgi:AcrR family transcriptional regulator